MRAIAAVALLVAAAGCGGPTTDADRAELDNIAPWNVVPKSSPAQLVTGFERFCLDGPRDLDALDGALRDGGYVPTGARHPTRGQVYLVDDRRPAIAVTRRMCVAQARARTGQTERVRDMVASRFPDARPMDPAAFGTGVEQAWRVVTPLPGIVATRRMSTLGRRNGFSVILFRPE